jgi:hypothetical protein
MSFSNELDGVAVLRRDLWSDYVTLYEAPESGYEKEYEQMDVYIRDYGPPEEKQRNYYIFRVRTQHDISGRLVSARYAKMWAPIVIGGIKGNECSLTFTYWFNPDGTRNLEFDRKRNLLMNLRGGETVAYP